MRKFLIAWLLMLLPWLYASSQIAIALSPQEHLYTLSATQRTAAMKWEGRVSFSVEDDVLITLPSRFTYSLGSASVSLGYGGFWQEYLLLPSLASSRALLYAKQHWSVMLHVGQQQRLLCGIRHRGKRGSLSALLWKQQAKTPSSYQTVWAMEHARWGTAVQVELTLGAVALQSEVLFTPVEGLVGSLSASLSLRGSRLDCIVGEREYPQRVRLLLDLQGGCIRASYMVDERFGSPPVYGGQSSMHSRVQKGKIRFLGCDAYLECSFSDTYKLTRGGVERGSVTGSVVVGSGHGNLGISYRQARGDCSEREFTYTLGIAKATLAYSKGQWCLAAEDTLPFGRGEGSWRIEKRSGRGVFFSLGYTLTIDQ